MFKLAIVLIYVINSAFGSGQFVVVEHPSTLAFAGKEAIDGQDVPTVLATSLGFTIRQGSDWTGMTIKSPFGFADVVTVVAVEGISSLGDFKSLPTFKIDPVQSESRSWRMLQEDVLEHYPMQSNKTLFRLDLGSAISDLSEVAVNSLDKMSDEDEAFLQDMLELNSYIEDFEKNGVPVEDTPVVNWFTMSSLHLLSDVKGADHAATLEAKEMVRESLVRLGKVLRGATNGKAMVVAIVSDGSHTRRIRAAEASGNDSSIPDNRATQYSETYPAIFNIMLWFAVAFIFSLIAISYFIGSMDPGRDSIIYRMTSNRMKKDS